MISRANLRLAWWRALLALVLLCGARGLEAGQGRYSFRVYEHPDGLEDLVIRDLLEDRQGFLWVATHTGLYRFDGRKFRRFTVADGLADNWVTNIAEDARGQLWVVTIKGLCRWSGGRFQTVLASREWLQFRPNTGTPLVTDDVGNLFLLSTEGLFAVRQQPSRGGPFMQPPLRVERLDGPGPGRAMQGALMMDRAGWLWYPDEQQMLVRRDPLTGLTSRVDPGLPQAVWVSMLETRNGSVWLASDAGDIYKRDREGSRFRRVSGDYAGKGRLAETKSGEILVPASSGFLIIRGDATETVDATAGLPGEVIECFLEGRDGMLWIGSVGTGLIRWLGGAAWRSWGVQDGMPGEYVSQIVLAPDGTRWPNGGGWIGTLRGLVAMRGESGELRQVKLPSAWGEAPSVYALAVAPDGKLWLSTARGTLQAYDPASGRGESFGEDEGFRFGSICHLLVHEGVVLIADVYGLSELRESDGKQRLERIWPKQGDAMVYRMAVDAPGRLWAATSRGLLRREGAKVKLYGQAEGLPTNDLFGVTAASDGSVWIHYRRPLGVTRVQERPGGLHVQHFRESDGLASDKVYSITTDASGRVWAGTEYGLSHYPGKLPWVTFNREHGLVWNDCNFGAIAVDRRGSLWVGTSKGLSRFQPPVRTERDPPPVAITEVRSGAQLVTPNGNADSVATMADVNIVIAALRSANQGAIRFRYRLEQDGSWIETRDREINFANLAPGLHRLEVAATEGDGRWSASPAVVSLRVPTPWWQQWWARGFAVWMVLAALRLVWRWRYHRMLHRQVQLETAVGERTRELEVQTERALAASKFKDQILANVSHEIRTPLNGIVGFTSLVLESNLDDEQREQLRTVYASGKSLVDIIEDLLDFASIEAGDLQMQEHDLVLAELLDQTNRTMRFEADRRGLELHGAIDPELPDTVRADGHRLRQVLLNLVGNAIKFTEKGEVGVRLSRLRGRPSWAEAAAPVPEKEGCVWVLIEVRDTGIGISPEHLEQIFEPFRQLDGTSRRIHGGTGLGLATVRRIVEMMGGAITVESAREQGSTFRVAIPMGLAAALPSIPVPARAAPMAGETGVAAESAEPIRRVLIAEDNPVNQKLLHRILARRGLEVYAVADGLAAFQAVEREPFDLILMDIQMPVMDGMEATRLIREREQRLGQPRIPVIAVTANGMFQCREECFSVGMDGYVVKPFGPASLFEAIDTVHRHANLQAAAGEGANAVGLAGSEKASI